MADNKKIYQGHPNKSLDRFDNRSDTFTDRQTHRLRYQEGNESSPHLNHYTTKVRCCQYERIKIFRIVFCVYRMCKAVVRSVYTQQVKEQKMARKGTPQERYAKKNIKQFKIDCVINTESDIIDKLMSVPNRAGYIKALIRADIAKEKDGE